MLDNYKLMSPHGCIKMPECRSFGCILEIWAAMEELVDEGKVRTLGLSNFTMDQLELLLQNCRVRPVVVMQERHILNQAPPPPPLAPPFSCAPPAS